MPESLEHIRSLLEDRKQEMAVVIGNGINRHYRTSKSWNDVLTELWRTFSSSTLTMIPNGISLTELYDLLDLENFDREELNYGIQKEVKSIYATLSPNPNQLQMLSKIESYQMPLLTTNFDDLMERGLGLTFHNQNKGGFTDFYPWECYYARSKKQSPTDGFGIWHINGTIKYFRSIKLGLSHYMGNVDRARNWIHGNSEAIGFTSLNYIVGGIPCIALFIKS